MKKLMMFAAIAMVGLFLTASAQTAGAQEAYGVKKTTTEVKTDKKAVKKTVKVNPAPKKEVAAPVVK
jgi:hypothetical protein